MGARKIIFQDDFEDGTAAGGVIGADLGFAADLATRVRTKNALAQCKNVLTASYGECTFESITI